MIKKKYFVVKHIQVWQMYENDEQKKKKVQLRAEERVKRQQQINKESA